MTKLFEGYMSKSVQTSVLRSLAGRAFLAWGLDCSLGQHLSHHQEWDPEARTQIPIQGPFSGLLPGDSIPHSQEDFSHKSLRSACFIPLLHSVAH